MPWAGFLNLPWVASQRGVGYPAQLQRGSCIAILLLLLLTRNGEVARMVHNVTCLAQGCWWMYTHIVLTCDNTIHEWCSKLSSETIKSQLLLVLLKIKK